jgi:hypothetical protein
LHIKQVIEQQIKILPTHLEGNEICRLHMLSEFGHGMAESCPRENSHPNHGTQICLFSTEILVTHKNLGTFSEEVSVKILNLPLLWFREAWSLAYQWWHQTIMLLL